MVSSSTLLAWLMISLVALCGPSRAGAQNNNRCVPGEPTQGRLSSAERELSDAMVALLDHISVSAPLSDSQLIVVKDQFSSRADLLATRQRLVEEALDLVDAYESSASGPLFVATGDFARDSTTSDGKELARTMLQVQQHILDQVYQGSLWTNEAPLVNPADPIIGPCQSVLAGRKWLTSNYFPGGCGPASRPLRRPYRTDQRNHVPVLGTSRVFCG